MMTPPDGKPDAEVPAQTRRVLSPFWLVAAIGGSVLATEVVESLLARLIGPWNPAYEVWMDAAITAAIAFPALYFWAYRPLTQRCRDLQAAQREINRQRDFVSGVAETSPVGIVLLDVSGKITFVNKRAEDLLGFQRSELLGRAYNCGEWWFADESGHLVPEAERPFRRVMARGTPVFDVQIRIGSEKRRSCLLSINAALMRDRAGGISGVAISLEDITARKQVEQTLAAEAIRRRVLCEQSRDGIVILDDQGGVCEANQSFATMLGYSIEEILRLHVWDWDARWTEAELRETIRAAGVAGDHFQTRHRRKDGTLFDAEISCNAALLEGRKLIFCVCRDITDRKRAEEALRKLSRAVEQSSAGVVITDAQGRIEYVNPRYYAVTGYTPEQVLGQNPRLFKSGQTRLEEYQALWSTILAGGEWSGEFCNKKSNGDLFWERAIISPIKNDDGAITHFLAIKEDFTVQKRTEEALRDSEARYRALVETTCDWVWEVDANVRYTHVSPRVRDLLGYTPEEVIGRTPFDLMPPEEARRVMAVFASIAAHRRPFIALENTNLHKLGRLVVLETSGAPIFGPNGEFRGYRGVDRDITERKKAEEGARASREQLRSLARRLQAVREEERTRLAREIHDVLAQELTCLKLDITWLHRRLDHPLDDPERKVLQEELSVMTGITNRTIESVQRIATELRPVVLDSLGLCAAVEWEARQFETRSGIPCVAFVPDEQIELDRERATALFRILQESLTNVARHADATRVEVRLERRSPHTILTICDNGRGIPADKLNDPYSVGLLGMRERALLLGGEFEILAGDASGTTIQVRLPLSQIVAVKT